MNINTEKEYKQIIDQKTFELLLRKFDNLEEVIQENIYYDTSDLYILKHKCTCRIRSINTEHVFTLKRFIAKELKEYEINVHTNDSSVFEIKEIKTLLHSFNIPTNLIRQTSLLTHRYIYNTGNALICLDKNTYNNIVDYEIEYEYINDHDGLSIFKKLLASVGVKYSNNTKGKMYRAIITI